jgi:hypothetical protein
MYFPRGNPSHCEAGLALKIKSLVSRGVEAASVVCSVRASFSCQRHDVADFGLPLSHLTSKCSHGQYFRIDRVLTPAVGPNSNIAPSSSRPASQLASGITASHCYFWHHQSAAVSECVLHGATVKDMAVAGSRHGGTNAAAGIDPERPTPERMGRQ